MKKKREYIVYTGESQKNPDLIVGIFFIYLELEIMAII